MKSTFSKNIRYLSALILLIFLIGTMASLSLIPSFALSPFEDDAYLLDDADRIALYLDASNVFESKEAKLETMSKRTTVGNYELYVETTTGEVAVKNILTGQILTTNPYDVASAGDAVKQTLMNQVSLTYCNVQDNKETSLGSFQDSALRRQITVKNIKNGIRVEYTLGKESSMQLVPGWVEYNRFETLIREPAWENCYTQADLDEYNAANPSRPSTLEERRDIRYNRLIGSYYSVKDPNDPTLSSVSLQRMQTEYPCTAKTGPSDYDGDGQNDLMKIYAVVSGLSERNRNSIESAVKQYTSYTFEDLQTDTQMTGYPGEDSNPALFRLALEYTLNADGMEVRLPANSIRFDEDNYRLISIDVLPYFGSTSNDYTGYTFIPDGSGTIVRNEEIMSDGRNQYTIRGQIYGPDFAYHEITKYYNGKSEIMHLPVYGAIEDTVMKTYNRENQTGYIWLQNNLTDDDGNQLYYTEEDRIMMDAVDSEGNLITTVEDYLAQFKYDSTASGEDVTVIRVGDPLWDSPIYTEIDSLERYNSFVEMELVPYIEVINFYLMAPALDQDGNPITYRNQQVYVYVDEEGNVVDADHRVEGVLKITEQLWYNGKPAYYNTDVPVDPTVVIPPEEGEDTEASGGTETDAETPEETPAESEETTPDTSEGDTPADTTEETTEEIEYYNDVPKVEEVYDEPAYEEIESIVSQGYFAIITEGDALCNITSSHGGLDPVNPAGGEHKYNSVYITVFPRPQDSYRLADAISVSNDSKEWVVVSDRKYTGSYRIKIVMLSDAQYEEENGEGEVTVKDYKYEASYVGMANAYRDYLVANGTLTPLTDVDDDIPLFLEAFGMTTTTKVVATIPVMMDVALTTFDDLKTIYNDLLGDGVDNVNFRLTGFSKGGLYSYAPSAMKFESVVGGNSGYEEMVEYCETVSAEDGKHLGIFPDFDFANVAHVGGLDGFSPLKDSARTIDDRYASKREYDSTYQTFSYLGSIVVSPSVYMKLYNKFAKKIDKLGVNGLSVGSLGSDLNSDFDSDDAYNREDSKYYTVELLKELSEKYGNIMIDGGNAYALAYADYILNMPLDSSRYARASASIPFMGMVLHGYVQYAGTATGMSSDIDRELLKIIENGAAPYFTIAYQNTSTLKGDYTYSDYYSIDYAICYEEIIEKYKILNEALADLQTANITDHDLLTGIRSLGENETREVELLMEAARGEGYQAAIQAATKAYNDRKALAERHGEEFTEVFEETYAYLETEDSYVQHVYDEYAAAIDRTVTGNDIVMVEYTRKDGTTKVFLLNYAAYEVTVTFGNTDYVIASNGFAVAAE